ncbi:ssDNA-binding protein [Corynebacterium kutscheri]|uniref:ssDNA-binding protein n=1 Tax=Corynebacterium kutscheri TaxID=35755 RepID=UPI000A5EE5AC|nr:ssDNA-binding protein [Corynebacterium kutscheri]VEH09398.1 phage protein [Corynebacterium kutscheri]
MSNAKLLSARRVRTDKVRFSYVHVEAPRVNKESGKESYGMSLLILKDDTETLKLIEQAIENALQEGIGEFGGGEDPTPRRPEAATSRR